jgi:hypothetical protein
MDGVFWTEHCRKCENGKGKNRTGLLFTDTMTLKNDAFAINPMVTTQTKMPFNNDLLLVGG